jgi:hypothetical protein
VYQNPPVLTITQLDLSLGLKVGLSGVMTKTRVSKGSNGQYKVTVPKDLADGFDLEGAELEWRAISGNKLEVEIHE